MRWNQASLATGGGNLFGRAGGSSKRDERRVGYAVLNGLRRVRLVVGNDFAPSSTRGLDAKALGELSKAEALLTSDGTAVVTSVLQTKEIMFFTAEDLDASLRAKLEAKLDDLRGTGLTDSEKDELELKIELEIARASSLQNSGYFSGPNVQMIPIDSWSSIWDGSRGLSQSVNDNSGSVASNWITIHAITTDIESLLHLRRNSPHN